jgi:hypothetical protein
VTPRSGVVALAAVLTLLLGACGADAEKSADADAGEPSASAPAPDPSSASPAETASTPEVAPATGPVIKVKGLRVNAPEGWRALIRLPISQFAYETGKVRTVMSVYSFPIGDYTLDELARMEVRAMGARGRRLHDTELDGTTVYHVAGNPEPGVYAERFGYMRGIYQLYWEVRFANGEGRAERDEVIESVLATARLG